LIGMGYQKALRRCNAVNKSRLFNNRPEPIAVPKCGNAPKGGRKRRGLSVAWRYSPRSALHGPAAGIPMSAISDRYGLAVRDSRRALQRLI
jgi:hypothetical protein